MPTSVSLLIEAGLIFKTPFIRVRLILAAPLTRRELILAAPSIGVGLTSAALSTRMRLLLAGLSFGTQSILVKIQAAAVLPVSHDAPLRSMTRQTSKTHFLTHPIMTSPSKTARAAPFSLPLTDYPLDCRFLSTTQKDYLENTLRRLEETNDEFLAAKNHEVEKELSEKLRSLTQELDEWRREVTALPSDSPNNTEAPPQQTKYMKRPEEEVPWSPAGREAFSLLDDYRKNSNDHAKDLYSY